METKATPRFKIQPRIKRTTIRKRQRYYFTVESNVNGQIILASEKYINRADRDEIMNALHRELMWARVMPEIDMDKPQLPLKYRQEK